MTKLKVKYFLLGAILVGTLLLVLIPSLSGIGSKPSPNYLVIEKAAREIRCPEGAVMEYGPWGQSGWMAKCQLAHGPFVAAENGHVVVKGEYSMGKSIGETKTFEAR